MIMLSSEMGVLDIEPEKVKKRWRLQPGKIFLLDLHQKKIVENDEIKLKYSSRYSYDTHLQKNQVFLKDLKTNKISKMAT